MHVQRFDLARAAPPPEAGFTGAVLICGYFRRAAPSGLAGAFVSFAPGARTPWKTNPSGQTLVVVSGVGRAQCEGGPVVEIRAGDLVWAPAGRRHWEGASPDQAMTCVALQEHGGGAGVVFGDEVADATYADGAPPRPA